jgi:hypothetical protein
MTEPIQSEFFPSVNGIAARSARALGGLTYLVVVTDCPSVDRLAAAAVQARGDGARLLVALARPRCGFTIDAPIVQRCTARAEQELDRLKNLVHQVVAGAGVDYAIGVMRFRGSESLVERIHRIAAATNRLTRRHRARLLPAIAQRSARTQDLSGAPAGGAVTPARRTSHE